jgi:hypothetical protein
LLYVQLKRTTTIWAIANMGTMDQTVQIGSMIELLDDRPPAKALAKKVLVPDPEPEPEPKKMHAKAGSRREHAKFSFAKSRVRILLFREYNFQKFRKYYIVLNCRIDYGSH